jgi:isopentenyl-diphosphate delta-isomerase
MSDRPPGKERSIFERKDEHLTFAARPEATHRLGSGIERYRIRHRALPGRDLADVDLTTMFLGHSLRAPLLVSSMTGGTANARTVNERLARAATEAGLAMALGSGRAALADEGVVNTFRVEPRPPLLLANLGAVQLRRGLTPADAERLVDLLGTDGLILHLNAIQEAIQPGGDTLFGGLGELIAAVVERLKPRPVIAKEVGFGLSPEDVRILLEAGVAAIDVAGAGGTNWANVEGMRDARAGQVAAAFADWGWPTEVSIRAARAVAPPSVPLIASGGIRDGVDSAIALALGATVVGLARPMLLAALDDRATEVAGVLVEQLQIATWAAGVARPSDLTEAHVWEPASRQP